jgi:hypothetical protein
VAVNVDEQIEALHEAIREFIGVEPFDRYLDSVEEMALTSGQLRYGQPGDWYRSITWSRPAWEALHGVEGPRGRR